MKTFKLFFLAGLLAVAPSLPAQDFKLRSVTIANGGGTGAGANYKFTHTIGQQIHGLALGTGYTAQLGFWPQAITTMPSSEADLQLRVLPFASTLNEGEQLTLGLIASNAGPSTATSVQLTFRIPVGAVLQSVTSDRGSCAVQGSNVTCSVAALAPWQSFNVLAVASVDPNFHDPTGPGFICWWCEMGEFKVSAAERDTSLANNQASASVTAYFNLDFGDAPFSATYHTLFTDDGARHRAVGPYFGGSPGGMAHRDADRDGMPSPNADGDNVGDGNNDEAGVRILDPLIPGSTSVRVEINAPPGGRVDAWIDFNGNHSWTDPGDRIFASLLVLPGISVHVISVPAGATPGDTYARFRISTAGGLSDRGYAPDGEDEDYKVTITSPPLVAFGLEHLPQGGATLTVDTNGAQISNLGSNGQDGVSIDLKGVPRGVSLSLGSNGFTLPGLAKLAFSAYGSLSNTPGQSLGSSRFEEHNGTVNGFWCCGDDWFFQAPRIEVYNGATLVGIYAVAENGFIGTLSNDVHFKSVEFVAEQGRDAFWCYDGWWWFSPPDQPSMNLMATRLRLVYGGSADKINHLGRLLVTGSNIDSIFIAGEAINVFGLWHRLLGHVALLEAGESEELHVSFDTFNNSSVDEGLETFAGHQSPFLSTDEDPAHRVVIEGNPVWNGELDDLLLVKNTVTGRIRGSASSFENLADLRISKQDQARVLSASFAASLGVTQVQVDVFDGPNHMGGAAVPVAGMGSFTSTGKISRVVVQAADGVLAWSLRWDTRLVIHPSVGPPLEGERLRITALDPTATVERLHSVITRVTGVDSVALRNASNAEPQHPPLDAPRFLPDGRLELRWPVEPDVLYEIERSRTLLPGSWTRIGTVMGTDATNTTRFSDSPDSSVLIYRIRVR